MKITAIIMYCDESILNLELGNGYTIEKCYYDDFPFKSEIENGKNQLCIEYIGSRLHDENGSYFICLKKEDVFLIDGPQIVPGAVITNKTCQCEDEIGAYQEQEVQYLHKIFSFIISISGTILARMVLSIIYKTQHLKSVIEKCLI